MSEEKKLAVLIDSDNVSAKYAQFVMNEVQKYGVPTYKRVYGDWEKGGNGWHAPAVNYSIMPVQQTSYVAGKNATDFSMIIDAMDILYTGNVDGFVLVTSDSDFTRLAIRLREAGKLVVGIGELKTPRPFTVSCHHFCYLNQIGEMEGEYDEAAIRKAVLNFVTENRDERLDLARISAVLTSKFGNINFDELGYKRFSNFIDSFRELRRNNTFVTLKKSAMKPAAAEAAAPEAGASAAETAKPVQLEQATEQSVAAAMADYFADHKPEKDNLLKLESYLNSRFGKIDFARFGSSRFAKFIDKLPEFTRTGTLVAPAKAQDSAPKLSKDVFRRELVEYVDGRMPGGANVGQVNDHMAQMFGNKYFKSIGFDDFKSALESVDEVRLEGDALLLVAPQVNEKPAGLPGPDVMAIFSRVQQYAAENMPDGGNLGQLNNELITVYGKDYIDRLGFGDYRAMLSEVPDIRISRNRVYSLKPVVIETAQEQISEPAAEVKAEAPAAEKPEKSEKQAEKAAAEPQAEEAVGTAQEDVQENAAEPAFEKPELNAIKREVLQYVAAAEKGAPLSGLGKELSAKYGEDFLKQLGLSSMRKLAAEINGVVISNNKLRISDEFAKQTEEIEQFVNEFARADGSHSIRALGIQLKERFEGFDFRNYGFSRFTDFINAIDGVKADRYHVKAVDRG